MRKIALILFLVIFSCSKDKDVEEEVVINYSLSITSAEGGTVNDSANLDYSTLNTLLGLSEVSALTVSAFTDYTETASNANSLVALSVASVTADKILFNANKIGLPFSIIMFNIFKS